MKRIALLLATLAMPTGFVLGSAMVASSQPAAPPPSEQAIGAKLMREIQDGLQCNVNLISVQVELAKAQARVKELEDKTARPK